MTAILLPLSAGMIGASATMNYHAKNYAFGMIDAELSGVVLGFAIFTMIQLFHRQASREQFEQWARGCMQHLTDQFNAAMAADALKNAGDENADQSQRVH